MVDATMGQGGHSFLFGKRLGPKGTLVGLDVDEASVERARQRLGDLPCRLFLCCTNFVNIEDCLQAHGIDRADFILADLGYSSDQLLNQAIGISFQSDMPLDMRIDRSLNTTAADIVNRLDEKRLADLIFKYGQDRASRRIARYIVRQRQVEPILTTGQLEAVVRRALYRPGQARRSRIHPATRTFQALRIAVNHELENLADLLAAAPALLKSGGHLAIISFHSLEDRLVKQDFRVKAASGVYQVKTKKPLVPDLDELTRNRRARSAKLRIARKV